MKTLTGWKEIATYLRQGVRTVQRWELIGLPIHRLRHTPRSPVIAFPKELDTWLEASHVRVLDVVNDLKNEVAILKTDVKALKRLLRKERRPRKAKYASTQV